jgi:cyclophilin family peptidyl-prolyl cis-trans isomerase
VFAAMPSDKRQRQDEGRLLRLEEQRTATQKVQRKRQLKTLAIIIGGVLAVAGLVAIFTADDAEVDTAGDATTTTASTATTTPGSEAPGVEVVLPGAGASITGETPCPAADGSAERTTSFEQAPPTCIDPDKTYTATVVTNKGDVVIELDSANAPIAVNNFVVLSRYHFYDNVPFHRIVPGFVNQAGDPVGPEPGTGGPGYTIADEPPADPATAYAPGTVAMAKTAEPDSGGSQFFFVINDTGGALAGNGTYTVFGTIVEGQEVSEAINALGNASEEPTEIVAIESVTITES